MPLSPTALPAILSTTALALLLLTGSKISLALEPLVKQGSCPSGYRTQGDYCVPGSGARDALPKSGSCPAGYYTNSSYCVAGKNAKPAIEKVGSSCPAGWYTSGNYCVRSR
ncbi:MULTISPECIES: hypothetical protein [Thiorhodovibrio]|uniref:hypothetical protein n=1 Tax=Thiorhodovibrio TaxID=61593 RepID=UPI001912CFB0|nr:MULTISPECIES: hypothetical protein [Thiorhodovibrio]MBK5968526.1 hypothetical protein [Thiorhodovibrio winogradskyi]WPL12440.1 hypothetical protein Thiosp_02206 [Thiorhodovibrio litoralis]